MFLRTNTVRSTSDLRRLRRFIIPAGGLLGVMLIAPTAQAQYFGGYNPGCSSCSATPMPAPVYQPPVTQGANCQTICQPVCQQMVVQPCYQTVPVTEMREEKQTVMRPVTETKYVDQTVTEYKPVTEARTAEVPVTSYQPVTEYQQVCKDMGCWQTRYTPNCRVSPCEYDGRPGLLGWMRRTGYEMRSAFTPKYTAHREYHPNVVTQTVPITRYVAQQGTQQVTYNVTRYEPQQTTRRVAVNETRMVAEEITVQRPVTAYRTVPVGTTVAYAPMGTATAFGGGGVISNVAYGATSFNSSRTALGPTPDPVSSAKSATTIPPRTAAAPGAKPAAGQPYERTTPADPAFGPSPAPQPRPNPPAAPAGASTGIPQYRRLSDADRTKLLEARRLARVDDVVAPAAGLAIRETLKPSVDLAASSSSETALAAVFHKPAGSLPAVIRSVRWNDAGEAAGPALVAPSLASVE